jgi:hypothetical protein
MQAPSYNQLSHDHLPSLPSTSKSATYSPLFGARGDGEERIPERTSFGQSCLATRRLTQYGTATSTQYNSLSMRKDSCDIETSRTLHVLNHDISMAARATGGVEEGRTMKNELGAWTSFLSLCLRASVAGAGFRRSCARTWRRGS